MYSWCTYDTKNQIERFCKGVGTRSQETSLGFPKKIHFRCGNRAISRKKTSPSPYRSWIPNPQRERTWTTSMVASWMPNTWRKAWEKAWRWRWLEALPVLRISVPSMSNVTIIRLPFGGSPCDSILLSLPSSGVSRVELAATCNLHWLPIRIRYW